jgi:CBS domain-containing protein
MHTVREIMRTELVTVAPDMSVHDLARLLADNEISGAPVVDVDGEVLGVVSMTDVIRLAASEAGVGVAPRPVIAGEFSLEAPEEGRYESDRFESEQDVVDFFQNAQAPPVMPRPAEVGASESDLDQYEVREIMTPANFHIHPDSELQELAAFLLRGRIHRALVMEDDRLVGIVTTVDLLRTMAEAS